jgi:hypothetical protein
MGRNTFEPALGADRWPWPDLDVFVLGSNVPTDEAPVPIATDNDPVRLLERIRAANRGRDVHLVGGRQTIEAFRRIGGLDNEPRLAESTLGSTTSVGAVGAQPRDQSSRPGVGGRATRSTWRTAPREAIRLHGDAARTMRTVRR